jgi:hypothetical protein
MTVPLYMEVCIWFNEDGTVKRIQRLRSVERTGNFMSQKYSDHDAVPNDEYIGASEPEGAWILLDEGEGHPRIMVLEGSWEADKE